MLDFFCFQHSTYQAVTLIIPLSLLSHQQTHQVKLRCGSHKSCGGHWYVTTMGEIINRVIRCVAYC